MKITSASARAGALLAALALTLAATASPAQDRPPATVLVDRAEMSGFVETVPILAQVVATVESAVAARTPGVINEVLFREGDAVERGQELVRLDADLIELRLSNARAALRVAEAGVEVAQARLRLADQALQRTSQLQGSVAFSRGQFEDLQQEAAQARSELARSEAQVGQAEAALAQAEYDLRHATIRAPFGGVVTERTAQPGSYLMLGESVGTLVDVSALEIEVDMPVRLIEGIEPGQTVTASAGSGQLIEATVRSLLPVEAVSTRTRPVRLAADLSGTGLRLASGQSVVIEVPVSAPREVLTIPKDALVQSGGGWTVFTVEDGKASPRTVTIGVQQASRVEVLSGLLPGDVVVVRGNERLRPGQPVTTRPVDPSDRTAAVAQDRG